MQNADCSGESLWKSSNILFCSGRRGGDDADHQHATFNELCFVRDQYFITDELRSVPGTDPVSTLCVRCQPGFRRFYGADTHQWCQHSLSDNPCQASDRVACCQHSLADKPCTVPGIDADPSPTANCCVELSAGLSALSLRGRSAKLLRGMFAVSILSSLSYATFDCLF